MLPLLAIAQAETPWWKLILSDIPHDAGAIVVYFMLGGAVAIIWWGNRRRTE